MSNEVARAHIVIPQDLLEEVDQRVGKRQRSQFIVAAVEEKLARLRLQEAARAAAGALADVTTPGWESSDEAVDWVRALRRADPQRRSNVCDHP